MTFLDYIKEKDLLRYKNIGGLTIGEKAILTASLGRGVYLCGDFVTASKLKFALSNLNIKAEIVSCGREVEGYDPNLFSFANNISKFLNKKLDFLIFLPSSLTKKFDLNFLTQEFKIKVGESYSLDELFEKLTNLGY